MGNKLPMLPDLDHRNELRGEWEGLIHGQTSLSVPPVAVKWRGDGIGLVVWDYSSYSELIAVLQGFVVLEVDFQQFFAVDVSAFFVG